MSKKQLRIVCTLSLIFLSISCYRKNEINLIKIGYLPIVPDLSFFVAAENGYFEELGLEVKAEQFAKSIQAIEAMSAGRIDATSIVGLSNLLGVEQNVPGTFKIYEMSYAGKETEIHKIIVRKDSSITALAELKGKTIGTFPGSQMKVFTRLVLDEFFNPETELTIVPLSPPTQKDALAAGRVDALFTLEPQGTIVTELGIGKVIYTNPLYDFVLKPFPTAASAISKKFLENNPAIAKKFITAIYRAIDFINKNPKEAKKHMIKYCKLDENIAQKVGIYKYWKVEDIDIQAVKELSKLYADYEVLDKLVDISGIFYKRH